MLKTYKTFDWKILQKNKNKNLIRRYLIYIINIINNLIVKEFKIIVISMEHLNIGIKKLIIIRELQLSGKYFIKTSVLIWM